MIYYRISKYDPLYRVDGIYQKDEWTSVCDIGKEYNGKLFTEDEYLRVEKSYIDFVIDLCKLQNIESLTTDNLENYNKLHWNNGQALSVSQIGDFIKVCLREECWGRLVSDKLVFYAGYDYYIHIGVDLSTEKLEDIAFNHNLFVEEWDNQ